MGAFTLTAAHLESGNDLGIGDGSQGGNADQVNAALARSLAQRINVLGVGYKTKDLSLNGQYLAYDNNWGPTNIGGDGNVDNVVRAGGSYNFGMAKVGAAVQVINYVRSRKNTQMMLTVAVPLGAIDLGASYALQSVADSPLAGVNGDKDGYLLYAAYNLSKRSALKFQYTDVKSSIAAGQENSSTTYLLMSHNF
jgi:hypothetical protein